MQELRAVPKIQMLKRSQGQLRNIVLCLLVSYVFLLSQNSVTSQVK